jgi:hypothetical protein
LNINQLIKSFVYFLTHRYRPQTKLDLLFYHLTESIMVELHEIEMKEVDPSNGSNPANTTTTTSKDEKKDADTLTLDGLI